MGRHINMSTAGTTSMHLKIHHLGGIRWLRKWILISRACQPNCVPQQPRTSKSCYDVGTVYYTSTKMTAYNLYCLSGVVQKLYRGMNRFGSQMWTFAYLSLYFVYFWYLSSCVLVGVLLINLLHLIQFIWFCTREQTVSSQYYLDTSNARWYEVTWDTPLLRSHCKNRTWLPGLSWNISSPQNNGLISESQNFNHAPTVVACCHLPVGTALGYVFIFHWTPEERDMSEACALSCSKQKQWSLPFFDLAIKQSNDRFPR